MALLLKQVQVYDSFKGYNDKAEELAANATRTEKATFKHCMNRNGGARTTIQLCLERSIHAEYTVVNDVNTPCEKLTSAFKVKLKLNILKIREDLGSFKLQDSRDVNKYPLWIAWKVED